MAKKRDRRRQERRRHHQTVQTAKRRAYRHEVRQAVEKVQAAFGKVAAESADEAVGPETFAQHLVELLDDELCAGLLATPELGADRGEAMAEAAGERRSRALLAAVTARAGEHPELSWLAVGLAEGAGDPELAERLGTEALAALGADAGADAAALVAGLRLEAGRTGEALEMLDEWCARLPGDDDLQAMRAGAFARARRGGEGDRAAAAGSLARFADRSLLYRLRSAVEHFVSADPELAGWHREAVGTFLAEVREAAGLGPFDELGGDDALGRAVHEAGGETRSEGASAAIASLAAEWAWLSGPDRADGEDLPDDETVLGRFGRAAGTPPELAEAARTWLRHVRYGLWQLWPSSERGPDGAGAQEAPGAWVTDLVTRRQLYAALPPEQLSGLPRWSVLGGAMIPVGGVWRSGVAMLVLDPKLADRATAAALETADHLVVALARERGIRAPRPARPQRHRVVPHGVLADLQPPMEEAEAELTGKVLGASLAQLVGMVEGDRRRPPAMANTDGDPIELLRASFPVPDPVAVRRRLLVHPDFEGDDQDAPDEGGIAPPLRWLGRPMTADEAASSLAQFRAEAAKRGWGPIEEPSGPRRWLRGTIHFEPGQVRVEVNSRRRLEAVTAALRRAGAGDAPEVELVMNPSLDLPVGGRLRSGRGGDPEAEAAWRVTWLDQSVPALAGATPRAAAKDPTKRVLLESLLRQFEHDADLVAAEGERPLDVAWLRSELGMVDGVLGEPSSDGPGT